MTGYAYQEINRADMVVSVELKGYNSRFLDLSVYLPAWLSFMEIDIRNYINSRFARGKIEAGIRVKEKNPPVVISINENAARSYLESIHNLSKKLGLRGKPGLDLILGLEGVLETETKRDAGYYRPFIESALKAASEQFEAERIREGNHTAADILSHIAILEESLSNISAYVPMIETSIKETIHARFEELLVNRIDENRVLAETAVLLMKYTISEELSRLASHLKEFRLEAETSPNPGKKLDFISQEINREINTIGSKTQILEISRTVVNMKNALENIREQLRNVE